MSAEAREKAKKHGQKSGKGTQLLSRLLGRTDSSSNCDEEKDDNL